MRLAFVCVALAAAPLAAQSLAPTDPRAVDRRIGTLESQMRSVQRKVFPGNDPKFFTPEIAPEAAAAAAPVGTPSNSAISDLTSRVDALERQLRTLTGQAEESQFKLRQLEESLTKFRGDTEFRLTAIEGGRPGAAAGVPAGAPAGAADPLAGTAGLGADLPPAPPAAPPEATASPAAPLPVEGQWRAAYARYTAKDYPGALTAMQDFLAANPKAARASSAQYWIGRTYMAQAAHAQAAKAFLDGYQKYPKGERGPDSLLWLGNALTALKKPEQACRALNELQSVYGAKLTPALKDAATKARSGAKCDA